MDETLAVESQKASSVKDSSSSFFCHHLLPSAPCLVSLSPFSSLIHCQERLPLKGQFCIVPHRERRRATDAITVSDLKQEAIIKIRSGHLWLLMQLCFSWAVRAYAKCLRISKPRTWAYLPAISVISLVWATRAFSPPTLALSCSLSAFLMCMAYVHEPCVQKRKQ